MEPCLKSRTSGEYRTGCSERPSSKAAASEEAKSYSLPYVEPLSEARTPLVDFVNSLLDTRLPVSSASSIGRLAAGTELAPKS